MDTLEHRLRHKTTHSDFLNLARLVHQKSDSSKRGPQPLSLAIHVHGHARSNQLAGSASPLDRLTPHAAREAERARPGAPPEAHGFCMLGSSKRRIAASCASSNVPPGRNASWTSQEDKGFPSGTPAWNAGALPEGGLQRDKRHLAKEDRNGGRRSSTAAL